MVVKVDLCEVQESLVRWAGDDDESSVVEVVSFLRSLVAVLVMRMEGEA